MWVAQKRSWEKQINTSSSQLGLEIRAQGDETEAFPGSQGKPIGTLQRDAAENEGRGLCLLGGRLEGCFLLLDLVGTGLRTRM